MSVPPRPPPPIIGKVTHHTVELSWSDALEKANEHVNMLQIKADNRVRVRVQEKDQYKNEWTNVYAGYAKRHIQENLEPNTQYIYRILFMSDNGNSEYSAASSVSTTNTPLTGELLHSAVSKENPAQIQTIIESGEVNIEVLDKYGFSPLMHACNKGHKYSVEKLLELGAAVDTINDSGKTALMYACFAGKFDCVKQLLDEGASYNIFDNGGSPPLHWAVDGGNCEIIQYMLDDDPDQIDIRNEQTGWTPLLRNGAVKGSSDVAKLLLKEGADIEAKDKDKKTPLMMAVINGHTDLVQLLLENGADINAQNESEATIAQIAYSMDRRMVIKVLENYMAKNNIDPESYKSRKI